MNMHVREDDHDYSHFIKKKYSYVNFINDPDQPYLIQDGGC